MNSTTSASCPECGQSPVGIACYHICSHSIHYYSPDQERYDDANYGIDRHDGWDDPDLYISSGEEEEEYVKDNDIESVPRELFVITPSAEDDIPF